MGSVPLIDLLTIRFTAAPIPDSNYTIKKEWNKINKNLAWMPYFEITLDINR